jgi:WD40 repeat protein
VWWLVLWSGASAGAHSALSGGGWLVGVVQHGESQINALEITPDRNCIAAAGYSDVRMYDLLSNTPTSMMSFQGHVGNVTAVTFSKVLCSPSLAITHSLTHALNRSLLHALDQFLAPSHSHSASKSVCVWCGYSILVCLVRVA